MKRIKLSISPIDARLLLKVLGTTTTFPDVVEDLTEALAAYDAIKVDDFKPIDPASKAEREAMVRRDSDRRAERERAARKGAK
jgi:uncharacterized protein (DUF58 family)